ncbi:MAG: hypothetical protein JWL85_203 [Candidatus Saccharibacteria bacterium]|nr:hypothetical protein [Candidatus Saccharibacteria bacterium]
MTNTKLPSFPEFTNLEAHHQSELTELIKSNHLYSDYNFVSLWSWDHQKQLQLCLLNGNLVIRFQDYLDPSDYFYSFIGTLNVDKTANTLLTHPKNEGHSQLKLIPQFVVENLEKPGDFIVEEDRDSFDYIVAIGDAVELKGHSESKRRALNKLMREHGHHLKIEELDIKNDTTVAMLVDLFHQWSEQAATSSEYKQNELNAIKKLLDNRHLIDTASLHVLGLYVDGKLNAFSINEILQNNFAMGHFKKALRDYKGIGVALDHYTAKSLAEKGISHLNHEQDLGIEGLRQSKLASNPVYFLKKYSIGLA